MPTSFIVCTYTYKQLKTKPLQRLCDLAQRSIQSAIVGGTGTWKGLKIGRTILHISIQHSDKFGQNLRVTPTISLTTSNLKRLNNVISHSSRAVGWWCDHRECCAWLPMPTLLWFRFRKPRRIQELGECPIVSILVTRRLHRRGQGVIQYIFQICWRWIQNWREKYVEFVNVKYGGVLNGYQFSVRAKSVKDATPQFHGY